MKKIHAIENRTLTNSSSPLTLTSARSHTNQANNTAEVLNDADFIFTTGSQKNHQSWEDAQPTQPPQTTDFGIDIDDEATDGGRTHDTFEKIYSGDGGDQISVLSYGYSLDDGIMSQPSGTKSKKGEDNLLGEIKPDFEPDSFEFSRASSGDSLEFSGFINDDASLKQILKDANITQENLNNKDDEESYEEDPLALLEGKLYERVCIAPPGKLGVIVDTTKLGPVVYHVKDESPLKGVVFPGDRIIGVDDIDTTEMTASNITKIMASKAEMKRRITVSSKKKVNNDDSIDV